MPCDVLLLDNNMDGIKKRGGRGVNQRYNEDKQDGRADTTHTVVSSGERVLCTLCGPL
jgi:hypothetical protein